MLLVGKDQILPGTRGQKDRLVHFGMLSIGHVRILGDVNVGDFGARIHCAARRKKARKNQCRREKF